VPTSCILHRVSLQAREDLVDDLVVFALGHAVNEQFIQVAYPVFERCAALRVVAEICWVVVVADRAVPG